MFCVAQGKLAGGKRKIVFSAAPNDMDMTGYSDNMFGYAENDIYYLEVCTLNEMCSNHEDIFKRKVGEPFICQLDYSRWKAAGQALLQLH